MNRQFLLLILSLSLIMPRPVSHEPRAYKKRGFGLIGTRCPQCGGPLSHGRNGNPALRKGQPPCTKLTALAQQAANDDARRRLERIQAKHEAWEKIFRVKAAAARAKAPTSSGTRDPSIDAPG